MLLHGVNMRLREGGKGGVGEREREHHFLLKKACVQEGLLFLVWLSLVLTWKSVTVAINSQDC